MPPVDVILDGGAGHAHGDQTLEGPERAEVGDLRPVQPQLLEASEWTERFDVHDRRIAEFENRERSQPR